MYHIIDFFKGFHFSQLCNVTFSHSKASRTCSLNMLQCNALEPAAGGIRGIVFFFFGFTYLISYKLKY